MNDAMLFASFVTPSTTFCVCRTHEICPVTTNMIKNKMQMPVMCPRILFPNDETIVFKNETVAIIAVGNTVAVIASALSKWSPLDLMKDKRIKGEIVKITRCRSKGLRFMNGNRMKDMINGPRMSNHDQNCEMKTPSY